MSELLLTVARFKIEGRDKEIKLRAPKPSYTSERCLPVVQS